MSSRKPVPNSRCVVNPFKRLVAFVKSFFAIARAQAELDQRMAQWQLDAAIKRGASEREIERLRKIVSRGK
jgi:hypothetical protein